MMLLLRHFFMHGPGKIMLRWKLQYSGIKVALPYNYDTVITL